MLMYLPVFWDKSITSNPKESSRLIIWYIGKGGVRKGNCFAYEGDRYLDNVAFHSITLEIPPELPELCLLLHYALLDIDEVFLRCRFSTEYAASCETKG